ncbi:hypothetical protein ACWGI8_28355, partial [Streptomyces sp. NPDC054841]
MNEDVLWSMAPFYAEVASELGDLKGLMHQGGDDVAEVLAGVAGEAIREAFEGLGLGLFGLMDSAFFVGDYLDQTALQTQYAKLTALLMLVFQALLIAHLLALMAATNGVSGLGIASARAAGQAGSREWAAWLAREIAASEGIGLFVDAGVQGWQEASGSRKEWDKSAALAAAVGGAFGGVAGPVASSLMRGLASSISHSALVRVVAMALGGGAAGVATVEATSLALTGQLVTDPFAVLAAFTAGFFGGGLGGFTEMLALKRALMKNGLWPDGGFPEGGFNDAPPSYDEAVGGLGGGAAGGFGVGKGLGEKFGELGGGLSEGGGNTAFWQGSVDEGAGVGVPVWAGGPQGGVVNPALPGNPSVWVPASARGGPGDVSLGALQGVSGGLGRGDGSVPSVVEPYRVVGQQSDGAGLGGVGAAVSDGGGQGLVPGGDGGALRGDGGHVVSGDLEFVGDGSGVLDGSSSRGGQDLWVSPGQGSGQLFEGGGQGSAVGLTDGQHGSPAPGRASVDRPVGGGAVGESPAVRSPGGLSGAVEKSAPGNVLGDGGVRGAKAESDGATAQGASRYREAVDKVVGKPGFGERAERVAQAPAAGEQAAQSPHERDSRSPETITPRADKPSADGEQVYGDMPVPRDGTADTDGLHPTDDDMPLRLDHAPDGDGADPTTPHEDHSTSNGDQAQDDAPASQNDAADSDGVTRSQEPGADPAAEPLEEEALVALLNSLPEARHKLPESGLEESLPDVPWEVIRFRELRGDELPTGMDADEAASWERLRWEARGSAADEFAVLRGYLERLEVLERRQQAVELLWGRDLPRGMEESEVDYFRSEHQRAEAGLGAGKRSPNEVLDEFWARVRARGAGEDTVVRQSLEARLLRLLDAPQELLNRWEAAREAGADALTDQLYERFMGEVQEADALDALLPKVPRSVGERGLGENDAWREVMERWDELGVKDDDRREWTRRLSEAASLPEPDRRAVWDAHENWLLEERHARLVGRDARVLSSERHLEYRLAGLMDEGEQRISQESPELAAELEGWQGRLLRAELAGDAKPHADLLREFQVWRDDRLAEIEAREHSEFSDRVLTFLLGEKPAWMSVADHNSWQQRADVARKGGDPTAVADLLDAYRGFLDESGHLQTDAAQTDTAPVVERTPQEIAEDAAHAEQVERLMAELDALPDRESRDPSAAPSPPRDQPRGGGAGRDGVVDDDALTPVDVADDDALTLVDVGEAEPSLGPESGQRVGAVDGVVVDGSEVSSGSAAVLRREPVVGGEVLVERPVGVFDARTADLDGWLAEVRRLQAAEQTATAESELNARSSAEETPESEVVEAVVEAGSGPVVRGDADSVMESAGDSVSSVDEDVSDRAGESARSLVLLPHERVVLGRVVDALRGVLVGFERQAGLDGLDAAGLELVRGVQDGFALRVADAVAGSLASLSGRDDLVPVVSEVLRGQLESLRQWLYGVELTSETVVAAWREYAAEQAARVEGQVLHALGRSQVEAAIETAVQKLATRQTGTSAPGSDDVDAPSWVVRYMRQQLLPVYDEIYGGRLEVHQSQQDTMSSLWAERYEQELAALPHVLELAEDLQSDSFAERLQDKLDSAVADVTVRQGGQQSDPEQTREWATRYLHERLLPAYEEILGGRVGGDWSQEQLNAAVNQWMARYQQELHVLPSLLELAAHQRPVSYSQHQERRKAWAEQREQLLAHHKKRHDLAVSEDSAVADARTLLDALLERTESEDSSPELMPEMLAYLRDGLERDVRASHAEIFGQWQGLEESRKEAREDAERAEDERAQRATQAQQRWDEQFASMADHLQGRVDKAVRFQETIAALMRRIEQKERTYLEETGRSLPRSVLRAERMKLRMTLMRGLLDAERFVPGLKVTANALQRAQHEENVEKLQSEWLGKIEALTEERLEFLYDATMAKNRVGAAFKAALERHHRVSVSQPQNQEMSQQSPEQRAEEARAAGRRLHLAAQVELNSEILGQVDDTLLEYRQEAEFSLLQPSLQSRGRRSRHTTDVLRASALEKIDELIASLDDRVEYKATEAAAVEDARAKVLAAVGIEATENIDVVHGKVLDETDEFDHEGDTVSDQPVDGQSAHDELAEDQSEEHGSPYSAGAVHAVADHFAQQVREAFGLVWPGTKMLDPAEREQTGARWQERLASVWGADDAKLHAELALRTLKEELQDEVLAAFDAAALTVRASRPGGVADTSLSDTGLPGSGLSDLGIQRVRKAVEQKVSLQLEELSQQQRGLRPEEFRQAWQPRAALLTASLVHDLAAEEILEESLGEAGRTYADRIHTTTSPASSPEEHRLTELTDDFRTDWATNTERLFGREPERSRLSARLAAERESGNVFANELQWRIKINEAGDDYMLAPDATVATEQTLPPTPTSGTPQDASTINAEHAAFEPPPGVVLQPMTAKELRREMATRALLGDEQTEGDAESGARIEELPEGFEDVEDYLLTPKQRVQGDPVVTHTWLVPEAQADGDGSGQWTALDQPEGLLQEAALATLHVPGWRSLAGEGTATGGVRVAGREVDAEQIVQNLHLGKRTSGEDFGFVLQSCWSSLPGKDGSLASKVHQLSGGRKVMGATSRVIVDSDNRVISGTYELDAHGVMKVRRTGSWVFHIAGRAVNMHTPYLDEALHRAGAQVPTWEQIQATRHEAEQLATRRGSAPTPIRVRPPQVYGPAEQRHNTQNAQVSAWEQYFKDQIEDPAVEEAVRLAGEAAKSVAQAGQMLAKAHALFKVYPEPGKFLAYFDDDAGLRNLALEAMFGDAQATQRLLELERLSRMMDDHALRRTWQHARDQAAQELRDAVTRLRNEKSTSVAFLDDRALDKLVNVWKAAAYSRAAMKSLGTAGLSDVRLGERHSPIVTKFLHEAAFHYLDSSVSQEPIGSGDLLKALRIRQPQSEPLLNALTQGLSRAMFALESHTLVVGAVSRAEHQSATQQRNAYDAEIKEAQQRARARAKYRSQHRQQRQLAEMLKRSAPERSLPDGFATATANESGDMDFAFG